MSRPLLPLIISPIGGSPFWFQIAFWLIAAGVIGGLAAVVPYRLLRIAANKMAKRIDRWHGVVKTCWYPLVCGELVAAKFFLRKRVA